MRSLIFISVLVSVFASSTVWAQRPIPGNREDAISWLEDAGNTVTKTDGLVTSIIIDYLPEIFVVGDLDIFPNLEVLHVNYTGSFYDYHMSGIARLKNLKTVYFYRCTSITDSTLDALRFLPNLEEVKLRNCPRIYSIAPLNSCKNLRKLVLSDLNKTIFEELDRLKIIGQLESLDLSDCPGLTDSTAEIIAQATSLKQLRLYDCKAITDKFFDPLFNLNNLEVLTVGYCNKMTGAFLGQLPKQLKSLSLYRQSFEPKQIEGLASLTQLEKLDCSRVFKTDSKNQDAADWSVIGRLTAMKELRLPKVPVNDDHLENWGGLTQLEKLDLSGGVEIKGRGLQCLLGMRKLKSLDLQNCEYVDSRELPYFANLDSLEFLDLRNTKVGNENMDVLGKLPVLKTLDLSQCKRVGDRAMEQLAQSRSIIKLTLTDVKRLSDESIRSLAQLKSLQALWISDNFKITGEGFGVYPLENKIRDLQLRKLPFLSVEGMQSLSRLPNLSRLIIGSRNLSDEHILALRNHPGLVTVTFDDLSGVDSAIYRRFYNSLLDR